jgi:hypothetical protein
MLGELVAKSNEILVINVPNAELYGGYLLREKKKNLNNG